MLEMDRIAKRKQELDAIPEEERRPTFIPKLEKMLKQANKELEAAKNRYEKMQKEIKKQ